MSEVGGSTGRPTCLLFMPFTYSGGGVPEICANLSTGIVEAGMDVHAFVPRARRPLPPVINPKQTLPLPLRYLKWQHIWKAAMWTLEREFHRAVSRADPDRTVAYFWPSYHHYPSVELLNYTKSRGIPIVREMVNTATSTSGPILDEVYARQGHPGVHNISKQLIAHEAVELPLYDHIFAPAEEVEQSLLRLGVDPEHILPTSYGWRRDRLAPKGPPPPRLESGLRAIFLGIVGIRKGVPELLEAWQQAGVEGELILVGGIEQLIAPAVDRAVTGGTVRHLGFVDDVGAMFRSADMFVFPTHEEGAPQVTYEAASCGLPIITTPMGTARLVEDGRTGVIVPAGDVGQLAAAIKELAASPERRAQLGAAAREAADQFEYSAVALRRGETLRRIALGQGVA